MAVATKVFIMTKFPKRHQKEGDRTYLCYEDTTPPWDQEIFFVKDEANRNWFCHETDIELSNDSLRSFAEQIKDDYSPKTEEALRRRLHNPLTIQVILCHAESLEELRNLLGIVKLQRPHREAA